MARKLITNEEYWFTTLADIMDFVTPDNVDDFIIDFHHMLKQATNYKHNILLMTETMSTEEREEVLPMLISDLNGVEMSWIDDGEHNFSESEIQTEIKD